MIRSVNLERGALMTEEERITSIAVLGRSPCDDNTPQLRAFGYIIVDVRVWLTDECLSFSSFKKKISRLKLKLPVCELTETVYLKFHPFAHPSVDVGSADMFFFLTHRIIVAILSQKTFEWIMSSVETWSPWLPEASIREHLLWLKQEN